MAPGQTYLTRIERSYISKPLQSDTLDRAAAESRLARYRSLDRQFGDHGDKLLQSMFNRIQTRNREVFGDKTLKDYLDMFSTSPSDIRTDLRKEIFGLMMLYARVNERIQLSSTVQKAKPNGVVVLNTTIDYYRLTWSPGGSYTTLLFASRPEEVDAEDPFNLQAPFRALTGNPFQIRITTDGNVLLNRDYQKQITRARSVLKRIRSDSHPIVLDLVRRRLLTKSYFRKLIYQAWFRPYKGVARDRNRLKKVVLIPPLYETGGLRRNTFHFHSKKNGTRKYRTMKNLLGRNDEPETYGKNAPKQNKTKKIRPGDFSRLYEVAGRRDEQFLDFRDLNVAKKHVGIHGGGWITIDPNIRHAASLHYREVAYRSKPEVKDEVLSQLIYTGAPPYDDFEPLRSGYGAENMYDAYVEHPRGYRLVHRLNIGMTRSLRSE